VDGLVKEGLVRRAAHIQDKRKRWAQLTANGAKAFEGEMPLVGSVVVKLWSTLTEEDKKQLITILSKPRIRVLQDSPVDQAA
jgi:DNA-binding MarR family transcriptional regulator